MTAASLTDPIPVELDPVTGLYRTSKTIQYHVGRAASGLIIEIPAGYVTDFASVPRLVRGFFHRQELFSTPSLIHDWLYSSHQTSKPVADAIFLEAMLSLEFKTPRAWVMFLSVLWFGGRGYYELSPRQFKKWSPKLFAKHHIRSG